MNFVELGRRFVDYEPTGDPEQAATTSYLLQALLADKALTWAKLLESRVVIVLGEAGSGKSAELGAQARDLGHSGKHAFFVRLDALLSGLDASLGPDQILKFEEWAGGTEEAVFFLDSVDEARLVRHGAFDEALIKLANAIGQDGIARGRFIISSRISEWNEPVDRRRVAARFSLAAENNDISTSDTPELRVVQLLALGEQQISTLAESVGLDDPRAFMEAVAKSSAWAFVGRPLDVINLSSYWVEKGRLGTLAELVEHDVVKKTEERKDRSRSDPLSPGLAREGAESLAASSILCRRPTFSVGQEEQLQDMSSLLPNRCSPSDWKPDQVSSLLARPLFDPAAYGKVRFHHRRVAEYLCASWVRRLVDAGCPIEEIEDLFFARISGELVLRKSLEPVIGWLALGEKTWQERLMDRVCISSPEVLLQHGDPQSLSVRARKKILEALVEAHRDGRFLYADFDNEQLQRLADPGLTDAVSEKLIDSDLGEGPRILLLRIVAQGGMQRCVDSVLRFLRSGLGEGESTLYAIHAVSVAGNANQLRELEAWGAGQAAIGFRVGARLCCALYPGTIDADGLLALFHRSDEVRAGESDDMQYSLQNCVEENAPREHIPTFIRAAESRVGREAGSRRQRRAITHRFRYRWLLRASLKLVERLVQHDDLSKDEIAVSARAVVLLRGLEERGSYGHEVPDALRDALSSRDLRQEYLACRVRDEKERYPERTFSGRILVYNESLIEWTEQDVDLVLGLAIKGSPDDREAFVELGSELWRRWGGGRRALRQMRRSLSGEPELQAMLLDISKVSLGDRLKRIHSRIKHETSWKIRHAVSKWWRDTRFLLQCARIRKHIKSGRAVQVLGHLAMEAASGEDGGRWGPGSIEALKKKFPRWLAAAASKGMKATWRSFTPLLPHEKPNPNQIDSRVAIGLTGINLALEAGEVTYKGVTEAEVVVATRYAVSELNGFPKWLAGLANQEPDAVSGVLLECVRGEWNTPSDTAPHSGVISKIQYGPPALRELARDTVLSLLVTEDPPNDEVLGSSLRLLLAASQPPRAELASLARRRVSKLPIEEHRSLVWFVLWIQIEPVQAIDWLEPLLAVPSEKADELMVRVCAALNTRYGQGFPLLSDPAYLQSHILARLVPIVFRHVRPTDDIERVGGGAYSPTQRDEAQDFRRPLLEQLASLEQDHGALDALRSLLEAPELADRQEYIQHLIQERASRDADGPPWTPEQVTTMAKAKCAEPRSERDLFALTCRQLVSIQNEVERADFSERGALREQSPESDLRLLIGRKLRDRAMGNYEVTQEEEVDQNKEPDLRVRKTSLPPISIEIKCAHKWSCKELEAALVGQLVGQYLRSDDTHFGVLLLGHHGSKLHWTLPDGKKVKFEELLEHLRSVADQLLSTRPDLEAIEVIGIDFRKSLTSA